MTFLKIKDRQALALVIIRLILGSVFILHGSQKLLGWFGGPGLAGFVGWAGTMGIPVWLAYLAVAGECVGGLSILLGIACELGAVMTGATMIGAIFFVHLPHGYFIQNGGYEYTLNLVLLSVALIIGGPGKWYLWDPVARWR